MDKPMIYYPLSVLNVGLAFEKFSLIAAPE